MILQESREEIVARVKERADIVQIIGETVDLKKSGARYLGLCPFHGEKTPSFSVHSGQQFFHCFGCGESGDVFSFVMKYHNLDFPSALREIAARYSITLPEKPRSPEQDKIETLRKEMFKVSGKAADIYSRCLKQSSKATEARAYMERRGIPPEMQERFGLGYAPAVETAGWDFLAGQLSAGERDAALEAGLVVKKEKGGTYDRFRDRVLFPIYEISGRVCGFGGRIIGEGNPKYLNSPDSRIYNKSKLLLGLYQQKDAIRQKNQAIIVEGNFDLVSLVSHGCENVVAPLGTALTREQLRMLKRFADEVVLLFDGDAAGVKAAIRSVPFFLAEQVSGRVAMLPPGHDPDTFVREEGRGAVEELIGKAENLPEFVFNQLVGEHGLSLNGKSRIVEELRPLVKAAASPLQRSVVISHFAGQLELSPEQLDNMLEKPEVQGPVVSQSVNARPQRVEERVTPLNAAQKRLVNFMVLNPAQLEKLEQGGLRECLTGSVGEILFLQLKSMYEKNEYVEPEELLSALPDGIERTIVSDLLLDASGFSVPVGDGDMGDAEANELLEWMQVSALQKSSKMILKKINEAQSRGDFQQLQDLLQEKLKIDRRLQGVES